LHHIGGATTLSCRKNKRKKEKKEKFSYFGDFSFECFHALIAIGLA
jgi:hypothetical protein